jgi:hypothetical protein
MGVGCPAKSTVVGPTQVAFPLQLTNQFRNEGWTFGRKTCLYLRESEFFLEEKSLQDILKAGKPLGIGLV